MDTKECILRLLKKTKLAVISTIGDLAPESAVLEFGETEDLELIFDTLNSSRKYKNLKRNKHVSFVIGWDENITVQFEGHAKELSDSELKEAKEIYFAKNPEAKRWEAREGITYFSVSPKWIRYSDLNKTPWDVEELRFD